LRRKDAAGLRRRAGGSLHDANDHEPNPLISTKSNSPYAPGRKSNGFPPACKHLKSKGLRVGAVALVRIQREQFFEILVVKFKVEYFGILHNPFFFGRFGDVDKTPLQPPAEYNLGGGFAVFFGYGEYFWVFYRVALAQGAPRLEDDAFLFAVVGKLYLCQFGGTSRKSIFKNPPNNAIMRHGRDHKNQGIF